MLASPQRLGKSRFELMYDVDDSEDKFRLFKKLWRRSTLLQLTSDDKGYVQVGELVVFYRCNFPRLRPVDVD